MPRFTRNSAIKVLAFCSLVILGCTAPAKYREATPGMTSEQVLALLGEPDARKRIEKPAPIGDYAGPKPSAEFLALPVGALIEVWTYDYYREVWTYVFSLEGQRAVLVDSGYYHPSIKY